MKKIKSLTAILMVLVIGVCLTGCVSKEEKEAANAEFAQWFFNVTLDPQETGSGVRLTLKTTDYGMSKMANIFIDHSNSNSNLSIAETVKCTLVTDKGKDSYDDLYMRDPVIVEGMILQRTQYIFDFNDVDSTYYKSLTLKIIDFNGEETTLTYYNPLYSI